MGLKFNPLTGKFDFVNGDNFSVNTIPEGSFLRVPENQQMIVYGDMQLDGDLMLDGDLVLIEPDNGERNIDTVAANTSLNAGYFNVLVDASSGDIDITLPDLPSYKRKEFNIKKIDSTGNLVNIIGTIDNGANATLTNQNESITLQFDGSKWWVT